MKPPDLSLGYLIGSWLIIIIMMGKFQIDGEINLVGLLFGIAISIAFGTFGLYLRIGEKK